MENSCAIIQTSAVNWSVKYTKYAFFPRLQSKYTSWGDSGPLKLSHFSFQWKEEKKNDERKAKAKKKKEFQWKAKTFDLFQLTYLN